jgi:hypothetical protein
VVTPTSDSGRADRYRRTVPLDTPWIRDELREHLSRIADATWLQTAAGTPELDELIDAIDETGVLEDPGSSIGYILHDEREASRMATLGLRLNHVLDDPTEDGWQSVSQAARTALDALA